MTANDWPASAVFSRPTMPLALEVRPRVTVPASEPAVLAVTPTLPEAEARMLPGAARVSLPLAEAATTSRLSWKAAAVTTAFVTARVEPWPTRTLPRSSVDAASVAAAKS